MTTKQWHNSVSSNVAVVCAPILAQHLIPCNWHHIHICLTSGAIFYTQMYVCSQSVAWSEFALLGDHKEHKGFTWCLCWGLENWIKSIFTMHRAVVTSGHRGFAYSMGLSGNTEKAAGCQGSQSYQPVQKSLP